MKNNILILKDYKIFENYCKLKFTERNMECNQFLRHKTILINPYLIKKELPEVNLQK